MQWEPVFGLLLVVLLYVLIYYRLMVRFYHAKAVGRPQKTFAALLSIPQYRGLDETGKRYARRWWLTLLCMTAIIAVLAIRLDFGAENRSSTGTSNQIQALNIGSGSYSTATTACVYRVRV